MPNELPISLIIEWKAFTNAQFGRNLTFKTREIYKRAEKIFFSVVPTVIDGWPERKGVVTEEEVHRVLVKQFAGATKKKYSKLSPTSINIYVRVWNTFLNSLFKDELLSKPAKIPRLLEHKKDRVVLTEEQITALVTTKIGRASCRERV